MDMVISAKTLGRRPGCAVMNIGAVMFDRSGNDPLVSLAPENQFYEPISALESKTANLTVDSTTLKWWNKQESWKTLGPEFMKSTNTIASVCDKLSAFIAHHKPEKIWSNSPTFHVAVVNHLYGRAGKRSPIEYRQEMDFRTLMDLVYVDRADRPAASKLHNYPTQHAVGDSIDQATDIIRAIREINPDVAVGLSKQRWMMIDIETLGIKPGSAIMSIGASMFDACGDAASVIRSPDKFYSVLNSFDLQTTGFKIEPETLKWWRSQPIWEALSDEIRDSNVTVKQGCEDFRTFINKYQPDKIWANSPNFDIEMLRKMFDKVKVEFPVAYQQEMDYRTVMELAYPTRDQRPGREMSSWFPEHHALGDAMEQSVQMQNALLKLGITAVPDESLNDIHRPSLVSQLKVARL